MYYVLVKFEEKTKINNIDDSEKMKMQLKPEKSIYSCIYYYRKMIMLE